MPDAAALQMRWPMQKPTETNRFSQRQGRPIDLPPKFIQKLEEAIDSEGPAAFKRRTKFDPRTLARWKKKPSGVEGQVFLVFRSLPSLDPQQMGFPLKVVNLIQNDRGRGHDKST